VLHHEHDIKSILKHVRSKDMAVQAGGNVGVWPTELAKHFKHVFTFEPDELNFKCMDRNITEKNIFMFNSGLGDRRECVELNRMDGNCGAHFVDGKGDVQILKLDDYPFETLDCLLLDIEGYEFKALLGALVTIKRFHPVIVCEEKGLGRKYGIDDNDIWDLLASLDYKVADKINNDVVYI
jgi:FkbM family methyltransferase